MAVVERCRCGHISADHDYSAIPWGEARCNICARYCVPLKGS